jgi:hypothetical protein
MRGGDLHWIWSPYSIYQDVDYIYGLETYEKGDGFPNAQSLLNIGETILNLLYVYLTHVKSLPSAPVIGFAAANLTLGKTLLYVIQDLFCNRCTTGHNTLGVLLTYYILPNMCWIVFPALIVHRLGKDIASALNIAANVKDKKSVGKLN